MTVQILNDFHGDGVFRDQQGTIWVRQSEVVNGMARAFDQGFDKATSLVSDDFWSDAWSDDHSPYRAAKGEQK